MCMNETSFSYFSTKTCVMGTQKNRLNETVLLSTQNTCEENINILTLKKFAKLDKLERACCFFVVC